VHPGVPVGLSANSNCAHKDSRLDLRCFIAFLCTLLFLCHSRLLSPWDPTLTTDPHSHDGGVSLPLNYDILSFIRELRSPLLGLASKRSRRQETWPFYTRSFIWRHWARRDEDYGQLRQTRTNLVGRRRGPRVNPTQTRNISYKIYAGCIIPL
jgi:hypothetical protein